jgi:hypothetical protein
MLSQGLKVLRLRFIFPIALVLLSNCDLLSEVVLSGQVGLVVVYFKVNVDNVLYPLLQPILGPLNAIVLRRKGSGVDQEIGIQKSYFR